MTHHPIIGCTILLRLGRNEMQVLHTILLQWSRIPQRFYLSTRLYISERLSEICFCYSLLHLMK